LEEAEAVEAEALGIEAEAVDKLAASTSLLRLLAKTFEIYL